LWKNASQNVCKNHEICTKNVLERAFKSTQNAVLMYKKRNINVQKNKIPDILGQYSQNAHKRKAKTIMKKSGIEMRPC